MKYLRYGCLSITKNIMFTVFMVLEIFALLVSTNIMIASVNSREMLKKPFDNIINHNGYYCSFEPMWEDEKQYAEFTGFFKEFKSASIYKYYDYMGDTEAISDEIFFRYSLPLKYGSWPKSAKDDQGRPYVVVSPDFGKRPGDIIYAENVGESVVSGVLTDVTYVPISEFKINDVTDFYRSVDYTAELQSIELNGESISPQESAVIMAESAYNNNSEEQIVDTNCFIVYDDDISEKDIAYNKSVMEKIENYNNDMIVAVSPKFTDLSEIKKNTDTYIEDIYNRMMPIILSVAAVILIGFIGTIAINTVTQLKNYGIYYLCGSRWSDCLKISLANISIILVFAGVVSALLLYGAQSFNLNYLIGQSYGWNNLIISVGIIIGMIILALIIPFGIIRFTSPVEVVKSEK